jgi:hypothetical protein
MPLPPNIPKRGLSPDEAAEYCGISKSTLTRHGPAPSRIGERCIYDRCVLDRWFDHLAGLPSETGMAYDPEDQLLEAIRARKDPVRHPPR